MWLEDEKHSREHACSHAGGIVGVGGVGESWVYVSTTALPLPVCVTIMCTIEVITLSSQLVTVLTQVLCPSFKLLSTDQPNLLATGHL